MRYESSVTSLSWIPSEAVVGANKPIFEMGVAHYDAPPPDVIEDLDALRDSDAFRFANRLEAWVEVEGGKIVDAGYGGGGVMGSTTVRLGGKGVTFAAVELPELREDPVVTASSATFVQTYGGRTALPAPRHVPRPPFVQFRAPLVWTTLALTIDAPAARSLVYDRNGNVMATFETEDRSPVKLEDVPQVLINAVLSIEDRKFYEHHGVDWAGSVRALFKNVDAGSVTQGGSTITQQLIKNTFSINRKRDLTTKAREAILAVGLEKQLTKGEILEDYMNLVYFGNGAYGVQAAVERYFPVTPLKNLSLAQAALLAGLIQSPEALNPITHPSAAARRRSEVLDAMVTNHKTTAVLARAAKSSAAPYCPRRKLNAAA